MRRAPDAGRYDPADAVATGPAMFDTTRLDRAGGVKGSDPDSIAELGRRAAAAGLQTASLDGVLCTERNLLWNFSLTAGVRGRSTASRRCCRHGDTPDETVADGRP